MNFWDTVLGHRLADTLIRELPKFNERKVQWAVTINSHEDTEKVISLLNDGAQYCGSFLAADGKSVVVLEGKNLPSADRPKADRPRGEWHKNVEYSATGNERAMADQCSVCSGMVPWGMSDKFDFCPNCGADMRSDTKK